MNNIDLVENAGDYEDKDLLLKAIHEKVKEYLAHNPELLMSHLYRLDVEESKIQVVLKGLADQDPSLGLAKLIYERQLQRMATKKDIKQSPIEGWEF